MASVEVDQHETTRQGEVASWGGAPSSSAREDALPTADVPVPDVDLRERYQSLASSLYQEADRLYTQKRYAESEPKVRQLLSLQEQTVGTHHPDFALGLCMLGELRFLQDDRTSAEALFRQAIVIRRATIGEQHPDYATSLGCLAGVLWRRGVFDETEALLREALQVRLTALGARHPDTVHNRKELARLLRKRGDWVGAEALLRRVADSSAGTWSADAEELSRQVVVLSVAFATLGERLASAARRMESPGAPLTQGDEDALTSCRREFVGLRERTWQRASALQLPCPSAEALETLHEVAALLDEVAEAELRHGEREEVRGWALLILDRVLGLVHTSDPDFAPLRTCQQWASHLRDAIARSHWTQLPAQTEKLAQRDHAFVYLLALVEDSTSLSDRLWARLHELVGEFLSKPLASAASRARLASRARPPAPRATSTAAAVAFEGAASRSADGTSAGERAAGATPASPVLLRDQRAALVRDLAVASLVPSMGRVINLPTESTADAQPHRLFRHGKAPEVVNPNAPRTAAAAPPPGRAGPPLHPEVSKQFNGLRRNGPGVIAGPLSLLRSPWPALEDGLGGPSVPSAFSGADAAPRS